MRKAKPVVNWLLLSIFVYITSLGILQYVTNSIDITTVAPVLSTTSTTTTTTTLTTTTAPTTTRRHLKWESLEETRKKLVRDIGDSPVSQQPDLEETRRLILAENEKFVNGAWNCNLTHFDYLVIVQVHSRLDFLQILIDSLITAAQSEPDIFVIVSTDVYNEALVEMIESNLKHICHTIVYHPYSVAFWRDQYPAEDPRDCSRDQKSNLNRCNSEAKADAYGHYREVKFSQIKLHWTWKLNFITQYVDNYDFILLLEEDYYLSEDVFQLASEHVLPALKQCEEKSICLGALGNYPKTFDKMSTVDGLIETRWTSSQHNMGMLISPKWVANVKKNARIYCTHDDYNWDYSLMRITQNQEWTVIYPKFPRVYHLGGECGYHTKKHTCNTEQMMQKLTSAINRRKQLLYPQSLTKTLIKSRFPSKFKGYGGWGDLRDRRLCLHYFNLLDTAAGALL